MLNNVNTIQPKPPGFREHLYQRSFNISHKSEDIWNWLNATETFTDTQIWPARVEFIKDGEFTKDFDEDVLNIHHGPLFSFCGYVGEITPTQRDLHYIYGSYFFSFRMIRPFLLRFSTEEKEDFTVLHLTLGTYVRPALLGFWNWSQGIFWRRFGKWCERSVRKQKKAA
jgi:hypothetical protein